MFPCACVLRLCVKNRTQFPNIVCIRYTQYAAVCVGMGRWWWLWGRARYWAMWPRILVEWGSGANTHTPLYRGEGTRRYGWNEMGEKRGNAHPHVMLHLYLVAMCMWCERLCQYDGSSMCTVWRLYEHDHMYLVLYTERTPYVAHNMLVGCEICAMVGYIWGGLRHTDVIHKSHGTIIFVLISTATRIHRNRLIPSWT